VGEHVSRDRAERKVGIRLPARRDLLDVRRRDPGHHQEPEQDEGLPRHDLHGTAGIDLQPDPFADLGTPRQGDGLIIREETPAKIVVGTPPLEELDVLAPRIGGRRLGGRKCEEAGQPNDRSGRHASCSRSHFHLRDPGNGGSNRGSEVRLATVLDFVHGRDRLPAIFLPIANVRLKAGDLLDEARPVGLGERAVAFRIEGETGTRTTIRSWCRDAEGMTSAGRTMPA
jgi:hypothetical protein